MSGTFVRKIGRATVVRHDKVSNLEDVEEDKQGVTVKEEEEDRQFNGGAGVGK